jgi:hypothetical protein
MTSGLHRMSAEDAESFAQPAKMEPWEKEHQEEDQQPKWKKPKTVIGARPSPLAPQEVAEVVAATVRQMQSSGSTGSAHAPSTALTRWTPTILGGPAEVIEIRSGILQKCIDSTSRAATSAKQAQRMCASASRAFGDEAAALDQCTETLQSILHSE